MDINPCVQDINGMTALIYAVKEPSLISIARNICLKKSCLDIVDKNGNNAVFHALDNPEAIAMLSGTEININSMNKNNETVLLYCSKYDKFDNIKNLTIFKNINVNLTDDHCKSAAIYLAEKGRLDELQLLRRKNCNFEYVNKRGESVLSAVIHKIYNPKENINFMASKYIGIIKFLAKNNSNFNIPIDKDGNTAIMYFMLVNDLESLGYVLTNNEKIDLSVKNYYNESACSLGLKLKNKTLLNRIMKHSSFDYEYVDPKNHNTFLMLASIEKPNLVQDILENNINVINSTNWRYENALILATKANQIQSVATLLKYCINVNQQDYYGNTSLYYAVDINNPVIIRLLLSHHADPNIKNREGRSPFDLAHEKGDKSILNLFYNPTPVSEREMTEEEHEPSDKYNEIMDYLTINIGPYDGNYILSDYMQKKMREVYKDLNLDYNDPFRELKEYNNRPIPSFIDKDKKSHLRIPFDIEW